METNEEFDKKITKLFNKFLSNISELQYLYRISSKNFSIIVENLIKSHNRIQENSNFTEEEKKIFDKSIDIFTFPNPYSGFVQPHSPLKLSTEERVKQNYIHKNKQYQWILVEAYELFEDFIVSIYMVIIEEVNSNLYLKELLNIDSTDPIILKNKVRKILNNWRSVIINIKTYEINNKSDINFKFELALIERFRHIIVHKRGQIVDLDFFIKKILDLSEISSNKELEEGYRKKIKSYICEKEELFGIIVLEDICKNHNGISLKYSRLEHLIGCLVGYALIISCEIVNYQKQL